MSLNAALESYLHPIYKIVCLRPNPGLPQQDDNPFLFTAHAIALKERLKEDSWLLSKNAYELYKACCDYPGKMRRWPSSTGDVSYDEIIGAAYIGWASKQWGIAHELVAYGIKTDWTWDIQDETRAKLMYEYARNISFVPFLRACARMRVGVLSQAKWSIGLLLSLLSKKGETSGKLLMDIQIVPVWEASGFVGKLAIQVWLYFMKRQYPKGRAEIYGIYFGSHPLATHQKNEWSLR
jgi:hypothetical protein